MVEVYLGLGSNRRRYHHLVSALDILQSRWGRLRLSRVFESEPIGFRGSLFLNMVVAMDTAMPLPALAGALREIEIAHGREADATKYSPRTLDIDILLYGDAVGMIDGIALPRDEILSNAFVLWPLSELAPELVHPVVGKPYRKLWEEYDCPQRLWPVPFEWRAWGSPPV